MKQDVEMEIIVVDNNSGDRTREIAQQYPVKCLFEQKRGAASARNNGLRECNKNSKYVAFVDSDVVLPQGWARKAVETLVKRQEVGGAGGPGISIVKNYVAEIFDSLLFYNSASNKRTEFVKSLATMNVMYKKSTIADLLFSEDLIAAEDPDFNFRIINRGQKLLYSTDLWVYHHNPTTLRRVWLKWFNYGKFYLLPYFRNSRYKEPRLWLRILYVPFLLSAVVLGMLSGAAMFLAVLIVLSLPFFYGLLGLRLGVRSPTKLVVFSLLHSLKQLAQMLGIWYGFFLRIVNRL